MAILPSDIQYFLSGGSNNTSPNLSLGGAISTTQFVTYTMDNLFADVSGTEAQVGSVKYRCIYIKNGNATLDMQNTIFYVNTNTPSPDDSINIGLGSSGLNGVEQQITDENTSPVAVSFSSAPSSDTALSIGNIPAGQIYPVWFQRVVTGPVTSVYTANSFVWEIDCRSLP